MKLALLVFEKIVEATFLLEQKGIVMLMTNYKSSGYFFNVNLTGKLNDDDVYRGDLVLELGEVTERGDRKPPAIVAKQCVLYVAGNVIKLLVGGLDKLSDISMVAELYSADFADDCCLLFFVHDIKQPIVVVEGGKRYLSVPLDDGMIWNEALELLCLEKSDLKGQSAEQKIATLLAELEQFTPDYPEMNLDQALTQTFEVKAQARGPV